jgi:hypothetical protein
MQGNSEIKHFVREILGCSCPEEVFNKIDCQKESSGIPERKVTVGDRLLVYIITMDGKSDIQGVISPALARGVEERDNKGFNRFRLVLVALHPDALRSSAERAFEGSGYTDEKTHLHVVNESDVEGF